MKINRYDQAQNRDGFICICYRGNEITEIKEIYVSFSSASKRQSYIATKQRNIKDTKQMDSMFLSFSELAMSFAQNQEDPIGFFAKGKNGVEKVIASLTKMKWLAE